MAQIKLTLGQVNITGYLVVVARKTTTPLVIEAQESYAPPHPATRNVVVPASGSIDPVVYYIDIYESSNGTSLDLLLSQFVYDLKNKAIISERRFYRVGSGNPDDPDPDQKILVDPYLDGKTISGVFKEGFRYLKPETEPVPEYVPYPGGGIELQGSLQFSQNEVYSIEISYLTAQNSGSSGSSGLYSGIELINTNTTLTITHRNKRLRCHSASSSSLAVTMESVSTVPDGTFYHFTSNAGSQYQTRILPSGSETVLFNGELYTEFTVGIGEFLRIVKVGPEWEAEMVHPFMLMVGNRFSGTMNDYPGCRPENGALYDGDEWPRPWWWLKNKLPSTHYIVDDNVVSGGYTHPAGKEGLFVLHSTLKKFRVPNTQGWSEKGLKSFTTFGTDAKRGYDYPGGTQAAQVGEVTISINKGNGYLGGAENPDWFGPGDPAHPQDGGYDNITANAGEENTVKNFGVVYMRRF